MQSQHFIGLNITVKENKVFSRFPHNRNLTKWNQSIAFPTRHHQDDTQSDKLLDQNFASIIIGFISLADLNLKWPLKIPRFRLGLSISEEKNDPIISRGSGKWIFGPKDRLTAGFYYQETNCYSEVGSYS